MQYSTFNAVDDILSTLYTESWEVITQRLLKHTLTPNKEDVGLFNGCVFGGSKKRLLSTAVEVSFMILDVDNQIQQGHPDFEKGVKKRVATPVEICEIESLLCAYEYVVVTSHSHTPEWPKYRVILPLEQPVPAALWRPFSQALIAELGLAPFADAIDRCYTNPTQAYYWPSSPPDAVDRYAQHNTGTWLKYDPATAVVDDATAHKRTHDGVSPFTPEQIAIFWASELPDLIQEGEEWRCPCVLHGGSKDKFYINSGTGRFYCQSECKVGGDIYKFVQLRYSKSFTQAKAYVHELLGSPDVKHTPAELTTAIESSSIDDVPALIDAISQQPKKIRSNLTQALITTHPALDQDLIEDQLAEANKMLKFPSRSTPVGEAIDVEQYGLKLDSGRYSIDTTGVYQMRLSKDGKHIERMDPPLADRPIWPSEMGLDVMSERSYLKLQWVGSKGRMHAEWFEEQIIRSREKLLTLDDAPISLLTLGAMSGYLTYAKTTLASDMVKLSTNVGWCGEDGDMHFILPGDSEVEYIGPRVYTRGTVDGWAEGLRAVLAMGPDGYRALCILGLSAASPFVRLSGKRNPVVGLVAQSSTGKNKVIEFAISIWDAWEQLRLPALSTVKGTQDRATNVPDFPVFIDELQQLPKKDPLLVEDLIYWAGNGQRRVTSDRMQKARGGERRFGVSFFAAEHDMLQAMQQGAQNRVIALEGNPLQDGRTGATLEVAAKNNCGVVGQALASVINAGYLAYLAQIEDTAWDIHARGGLKGDDHYTLAFMSQGLRLLEEVSGEKIDDLAVLDWMYTELTVTRKNAKDTPEDVFVYVMEAVMSLPWGLGGDKEIVQDVNGGVAWRGKHIERKDADRTPLEISPSHPMLVEILKRKWAKESIAKEWIKRGWLMPQGPNSKWIRGMTCKHAPGARVWRITVEGLAKIGLDANLDSLEP